jgi:hypothetical protein
MKTRLNSSAFLTASAFVIGAVVVVQAGRLLTGGPAQADLVSTSGVFTALTSEATNSNDVLLVLDGRAEELLVYKVENQNAVELYKKYNVPRLMSEARGRHTGRK